MVSEGKTNKIICNEKQLIYLLRYMNKKLNRKPNETDFDDNLEYLHMLENCFGSLDEALEIAGLNKKIPQKALRYSEEDLFNALKDKSLELNRIPKGNEMKSPSLSTYIKRFGSWEMTLAKFKNYMEDAS